MLPSRSVKLSDPSSPLESGDLLRSDSHGGKNNQTLFSYIETINPYSITQQKHNRQPLTLQTVAVTAPHFLLKCRFSDGYRGKNIKPRLSLKDWRGQWRPEARLFCGEELSAPRQLSLRHKDIRCIQGHRLR